MIIGANPGQGFQDQGESKMTAKEMTAAIEAATNTTPAENLEVIDQLELANMPKVQTTTAQELGRLAQLADEEAHRNMIIGRDAIKVAEATEMAGSTEEERVIASNNEIKQLVAAENGYAEAGELTPGENVVGGESAAQIEERKAAELETEKIDSGVGLSDEQRWMHKIAKKSGKELIAAVQDEVAVATKGDFNPAKLESRRFRAMTKIAASNGGASFGSDN